MRNFRQNYCDGCVKSCAKEEFRVVKDTAPSLSRPLTEGEISNSGLSPSQAFPSPMAHYFQDARLFLRRLWINRYFFFLFISYYPMDFGDYADDEYADTHDCDDKTDFAHDNQAPL